MLTTSEKGYKSLTCQIVVKAPISIHIPWACHKKHTYK